jgi:uncharacterized protein YjiS (DUF1127 family)
MAAVLSLSMLLAAALRRRLGQVRRAIQNRRAAAGLAGLDDHMLADIGITRSDLRDAYSQPLWHDPTDILASRAAERRTRKRSAVRANDEPKLPWLVCKTASCQ